MSDDEAMAVLLAGPWCVAFGPGSAVDLTIEAFVPACASLCSQAVDEWGCVPYQIEIEDEISDAFDIVLMESDTMRVSVSAIVMPEGDTL